MCGFGVRKWRLGGYLPVLEHEHRLEQTCDARGGLEVAEVGLHRADGQRRVGGTILAQCLGERVRLDGISHGGAGAVRLDVADAERIDAACAHASRTSRDCASGLGSEIPFVWPS